ncbi:MAG: glycosyltransferase family 39 protein [Anaerolineae bacterium]|nr:glycosyltransferase family 39 protein [Anaerolineae bacterium]
MRFHNTKREKLICLGLFILALLPRIMALNTFITWDEPMWVYRSLRFLSAIGSGRFADTFQVGVPGVTIMWAGALGIASQLLLGRGVAEWNWLQHLATLDLDNVAALRSLSFFLVAAKLPLVLLGAASAVGVYLLAKKLFGGRVALLAALLISFDPFHLAHSRVFHTDGAAANLVILSILSLLVYLRRDRSLAYLGLSGFLAGLAFLTKATVFVLLPLTALLLGTKGLTRSATLRLRPSTSSGHRSGKAWAKRVLSSLRSLSVWCVVAGSVFVAFWPAMWVSPVETLRGAFGLARRFAATPHALNFFMGQAVSDPGFWFYPISLLFRTTPIVWVGLLAAFWAIRKKGSSKSFGELALIAYVTLLTITLALGAKKFERYLLPAFPALDILAAAGWVYVIEAALAPLRRWRWGIKVALSLVVLLQAALALPYHPYYLVYANPLLGGPRLAAQVMPTGWGEGMDLAAGYLNQKEDAASLRVATWGIPGFAPLFKGQTEELAEHKATADYAVLYVGDVQQDSPSTATLYDRQQPEHVVSIHGVDYAWIYRTAHYQELIAYLESQAEPNDIVLLDASSPFVKHYQGPLPYYVIVDSQSWNEMTEMLTESAGPQRLWYVAYPESNAGSRISFQLNTQALLIGQEALPPVTVSSYLLTSPLALDSSPIKVQSNVNFGNRLRLTGYGLTEDAAEYRKQLGITLRWETTAEMQEGYALSLRLVDEQGHLWGQVDEWLLNQSGLPTSAWKTGETSEARYLLPVPPGVPSGRYLVKATVYQTDTLERVDILDEGRRLTGVEYTLGMISITSPTVPPTLEELAIPHDLRHDFDGQMELLGYDLSTAEMQAGEVVRVILFWRAVRTMESDYRLHLQVQDNEENVWAEGEFPLANEGYPANRWNEGEVIKGQYDLVVDAAAPSGEFSLLVNLLDESGGLAVEKEGVKLARLSVIAPERLFTVPTAIQHPLRASLADEVAFLGYDLGKATVKPGGTLHLTLYWQALARMEISYTVFVHLLDVQNSTWGQKDNLPIEGTYPTTSWLPGEVVIDEYEIVVDATAPTGEYQIEVGMYDLETMQRLPVFDEAESHLYDDRILLESLIIVESGRK